jgi:hypothetical protein
MVLLFIQQPFFCIPRIAFKLWQHTFVLIWPVLYYPIKIKPNKQNIFVPFFVCVLLVCTYFLFEINMIKDMHDYYLFPFLPFLFIVVAYGAKQLLAMNKNAFLILILISLLYFLSQLFCACNRDGIRIHRDSTKIYTPIKTS